MKYGELRQFLVEFAAEWRRAPMRATARAVVHLAALGLVAALLAGSAQAAKNLADWLMRPEPVPEPSPTPIVPEGPSPDVLLSGAAARIDGPGTRIAATVDRVVDGDTIRVFLDHAPGVSLSVRLLGLDTEESLPNPHKPTTELGREAERAARAFAQPGDRVSLEFPGNEPPGEALQVYEDNFGRLGAHLWRDGVDYQERTIEAGLSPYFTKYGAANITANHRCYVAAERRAQAAGRGIWSAEERESARDYADLTVWWELRARSVADFQRARAVWPDDAPPLLSSARRDHDRLFEAARRGEEVVLFATLSEPGVRGDAHGVVNTGSLDAPSRIVIPNLITEAGDPRPQAEEIVRLIRTRYAGSDARLGRSYAFVRGRTRLLDGRAELVLRSHTQIADIPWEHLPR